MYACVLCMWQLWNFARAKESLWQLQLQKLACLNTIVQPLSKFLIQGVAACSAEHNMAHAGQDDRKRHSFPTRTPTTEYLFSALTHNVQAVLCTQAKFRSAAAIPSSCATAAKFAASGVITHSTTSLSSYLHLINASSKLPYSSRHSRKQSQRGRVGHWRAGVVAHGVDPVGRRANEPTRSHGHRDALAAQHQVGEEARYEAHRDLRPKSVRVSVPPADDFPA